MKLLEVSSLTKSFKNFQAVSDLSFTVYQGDIYGFLGPNGAGKSTTLRMILGLIYPSSGEITFDNKLIQSGSRDYLKSIGALIERPDFHLNLTAYQNLALFARLSKIPNRDQRIIEVLREVKLLDRKDSKVKSYSQGMKQRLGIAQALLHKPKLIILDEPSNGLDPQGQSDMRDLIVRINREMGITIILSSHILSEIEQIANRMIIISKGKKLREGGVKELMSAEEMNVEIRVNDLSRACQILQKRDFNLTQNETTLKVKCEENRIPEMAKILISDGLEIFEIKQLRTLEEYFIHLTQ